MLSLARRRRGGSSGGGGGGSGSGSGSGSGGSGSGSGGSGSSTHGKESAEALVQPRHQLPGRKPKNNIHFEHCHIILYITRKSSK